MKLPLRWAALGLLLVVACGSADSDLSTVPGPLMRPGWNCLASGCHFPDKKPSPPDWSAGGTVFAAPDARPDQGLAGATVMIRDATGKEIRLTTNAAGNFYTAEDLAGPLAITVDHQGRRATMPEPAPAGSCNFCHEPTGDAKGRIYVK
jgi:hypothetical protein